MSSVVFSLADVVDTTDCGVGVCENPPATLSRVIVLRDCKIRVVVAV